MKLNYRLLSIEDKINLLKKEIEKLEHEIAICELVYSNHDTDCYEDVFRDNIPSIEDKIMGIKVAIKNMETYGDSEGEVSEGEVSEGEVN
jgi:transcription antitermination factor NusA-like protein